MNKPKDMNGDHGTLYDRIHSAEKTITECQTTFAKIIADIVKTQERLKTNQEWHQRLILAVFIAVVVTRFV